ncbi:MAG: tetratricopeptide repeat protein [Nitrospina sp.]|nr:tetratricopeptide repeat protein [Nitrospina sp.]
MSFKSIICFLFFTLVSVYFSFLNPHGASINISQDRALQLPMIVLILGSVLIGFLIAGFLHGTLSLKFFFRNLVTTERIKRQNKTNRRSQVLLEEVENYLACGYVSKAVSAYEKILNTLPNDVIVLTRFGNLLREEGKVKGALKLHLKAVEIAPENLNALYGLADDYCAKAIPEKEMEVLNKILRLDRKSPLIFYRMRKVYLKSENWKSAADVQRKLVGRIKGREKIEKEKIVLAQYLYKNGARYFNNDNFDIAIIEFKSALRENNKCLPAHLLLGDAYLQLGEKKEALKAWGKAYASTKSISCMLRMEEVYKDLGQEEKIIKKYKAAISNSKDETREILIMLLGVLYLEKKSPQEAIRVIEENTNSEKSFIASLILGDAYKQDSKETKSQKLIENATRQVKRAIFNFKCGRCGNISGKWTDNCSSCNTFDTLECLSRIN